MIELVDMCSLQDPANVDFGKMRDSGVRGVWFKASQYSSQTDATFAIGVKRAREAGLAVGAYHFCYLGSDPLKQMTHFYRSAQNVGCSKGDLPAMIDWEYSVNGDDGRPLKGQDNVNWLEEAAAQAEFLFGRIIIYTYPHFAKRHQPFLGAEKTLGRYDLCLAAYPTIHPWFIPEPWTKATVHQYAGNGGRVPGVAVACDRDRFLGTEEEFQGFLGFDITQPVEEFSGRPPAAYPESKR